MFDESLREVKEKVLLPTAKFVGITLGLSANALTLISGIIGLLSAWHLYKGENLTGLFLWCLSRILDGLDGSVARVTGTQSDLGGYLDLLVDHICYIAVPWSAVLRSRHSAPIFSPTGGGGAPIYGSTADAFEFLLAAYFLNSVSLWVLASIVEKRNRAVRDSSLASFGNSDGVSSEVEVESGVEVEVEGAEGVRGAVAKRAGRGKGKGKGKGKGARGRSGSRRRASASSTSSSVSPSSYGKKGPEKRKILTSVEMPRGLVEGAETVVVYALFFVVEDHARWFWGFGAVVTLNVVFRYVWACRNIT